jgi:prepilin-type N-terminal cleavage/methylation domain-containing protein
MQNSMPPKKHQGFTLLELMIVLAVISILGALTIPKMMTVINDVSLRYVASDLSGLLQSARMQAVRTNVSESVMQGVLGDGTRTYYIDRPGRAYAAGDVILPLNPNVTVWLGPGSGAPNEAAFLASLNFAIDPAADPPSFSPRGLPCILNGGICNPILGQGFVVFITKPGYLGDIPWFAIVVNPSAHIQIWSCDRGGTWIQRD